MKRQIGKMLLAACLVVSMLPFTVSAGTGGVIQHQTPDGKLTEAEAVQDRVKENKAQTAAMSNEELFAEYLERLFLGESQEEVSLFGETGHSRLTSALDLAIYDYLRAEIEKIAAGERISTEIEIPVELIWQIVFGDKITERTVGYNNEFLSLPTLTAEDLGVESLIAVNEKGEYYIPDSIINAYYSSVTPDYRLIVDCLLNDLPYDLYWYDKVNGYGINNPGFMVAYASSEQIWCVTMPSEKFVVSFSVAADYQAAENGELKTFQVDAERVQRAQTAAENARAIVEQFQELSDDEKIRAYQETICRLTSYDEENLDAGSLKAGIDPWQLVNVFDGDPETKVVCEGYAKAFQYLFEMSSFRSKSMRSILVSGSMLSISAEEESSLEDLYLDRYQHMWNIVRMNDGKNYLLDVTNSDEGAVGGPEEEGRPAHLVLRGMSGSVQDGYRLLIEKEGYYPKTVYYAYDEDTVNLYGSDQLILSDEDYRPDFEPMYRYADPAAVETAEELLAALPDGEKEPDENNIIWIDTAQLESDITVDRRHSIRTLGKLIVPDGCTLTIEDGAVIQAEVEIRHGGRVLVKSGGGLWTTMAGEKAVANSGTLIVEEGGELKSMLGGHVANQADGILELDGTFYCACFRHDQTDDMWFDNDGTVSGSGLVVLYNIDPEVQENGDGPTDLDTMIGLMMASLGQTTRFEDEEDVQICKMETASDGDRLRELMTEEREIAGEIVEGNRDVLIEINGDVVVPEGSELTAMVRILIPEDASLTIPSDSSLTAGIENHGKLVVQNGGSLATVMGGDIENNRSMVLEKGGILRSQMGGSVINRDNLQLDGTFYCQGYKSAEDDVPRVWFQNHGMIRGEGEILVEKIHLFDEEFSEIEEADEDRTAAAGQIEEMLQSSTVTATAVPVDHVWGEPVYTWNEDLTACTAERVCSNNPAHKETAEASVTKTLDVEAENYVYSAVFSEEWCENSSREQTVEMEDCTVSENWETSLIVKTMTKPGAEETPDSLIVMIDVKDAENLEEVGNFRALLAHYDESGRMISAEFLDASKTDYGMEFTGTLTDERDQLMILDKRQAPVIEAVAVEEKRGNPE